MFCKHPLDFIKFLFFNFCVDHSFLPPKFILVYPIFTANCEVLADTV